MVRLGSVRLLDSLWRAIALLDNWIHEVIKMTKSD